MATAKPFVMGIGGGSGSGKSTIVKEILKQLGTVKVSVIQHDSYYKNRPELSFEERTKINFDHPDSLETNLLVEHLNLLISGKNVEHPVFHHFTKYLRDSSTKKVVSRPILIVEGILVLNDKELRDLMNLKIFIDVPPDLIQQTVRVQINLVLNV
jgi:uridine kinase